MQFRTEFNLPPSEIKMAHDHKIMTVGSCFALSIGNKLKNAGFNVSINPSGILFNPDSIKDCIGSIVSKKIFRSEDFFFHNGKYSSFRLHSDYSGEDEKEVLEKINASVEQAHRFIREAGFLFVTLGSAWVYEHISTGKIVANCHKVPGSEFRKKKMGINDIISNFSYVISHLKNINPGIKIIFTISPVRHIRDGFVENQWSKSTLNVAVHELLRRYDDVYYFPAYEFVIDDLRDYRFFEKDMVHPNDMAVDYVWEKFKQHYFTSDTIKLSEEVEQLNRNLMHRPFLSESEAYKSFVSKNEKELSRLKKLLPHLQMN